VNKFKDNLDNYIRNNKELKYVTIYDILYPLEPIALICMLTETVLGKLGKRGSEVSVFCLQ